MHHVQILLSLALILSVKNVTDAGKLEEDIIKTARVAFRGSHSPAIVCRTYQGRCDVIIRAVHNAGIVTTHWTLKNFRENLNLLKREILLKYDAIVFIIRSLEYFAKLIQKLILVHSQARYVIVEIGGENEVDCCRGSGLELFQEFWREKRMHRMVVLGLGCPGFALTADVFEKNKTNCMQQISTDDAKQLHAVLTRRIKNMNGHVLRISMSPAQDLHEIKSDDGIPYEGVDATILREYVRYLNFTVKVNRAPGGKPYAYTFPNGTVVGSAIDLTTGKSDIAFNGNFMYYLGSTPAQISTWYKEDSLCVVIKKAGRVPKLMALFTPFSQDFAWAVFGVICLVSSVLYGVRWVFRSFHKKPIHCFNIVATVLSHMVESPILQKKRSNTERLLLASCSLWAMVVLGTYQGCLRGTLTIPKDLKDIDTLKELDEGGYQIYVISENLKTVFQSPGSQLGERLVKKTVLVNDTRLTYKNQRDYVASITREETSYKRVRPDEHLISECVRRSQLSFFLRVGSPASRALNKMLSAFGEGGIIQFMEETERREKDAEEQRLAITSGPGQFTLADVQGAFLILAFGLMISSIVFGLELLDGCSRPKLTIHLHVGTKRQRKLVCCKKRITLEA